jgi:general secretion pathway protein A
VDVLVMESASCEEHNVCLTHLLSSAGSPHLMSQELINTLCDHAAGNYRVLPAWPVICWQPPPSAN